MLTDKTCISVCRIALPYETKRVDSDSSSGSKDSIPIVVPAVVAPVGVFVLILSAIIFVLVRHRRRSQREKAATGAWKVSDSIHEPLTVITAIHEQYAIKRPTRQSDAGNAGMMVPAELLPDEAELTEDLCLARGFFVSGARS